MRPPAGHLEAVESHDSTVLEADPDRVVALLHPLRRQVLQLLTAPDSATGLGRTLDVPRQKVNYHLRALEELGMVRRVGQRQRRGLTEHLFVRTHVDVLVDPLVVEGGPTTPIDQRGLRAAAAAAVGILRSVRRVWALASRSEERVATVTLDAVVRLPSPRALQSLTDDLRRVLEQHDHPDSPGAMRLAVTTVVLPVVSVEEAA